MSSSARGAAGAVKPKLHNVNSVYAGKNQNAVKAPGLGKHGGLQSLGKTAAVVRRMPPPATLPSLRAESQGQDPNIALVPQGGSGWAKGDANSSTSNATDSQPVIDASINSQFDITVEGTNQTNVTSSIGGTISPSSGNLGNNASLTHNTDLRPKWAKQPTSLDAQLAAQSSASASSRDFPSLAAATAKTAGKSNAAFNESLKPQKSGSWRAGGSSSGSKNEGTDLMASAPQHATTYLTASSVMRNAERQLPSRYYDTTPAPLPPSGTFHVPKITANITTMKPNLIAQEANSNGTCTSKAEKPIEQTATNPAAQNATNVTILPPNYSQPPPNYVSELQDSMPSAVDYTTASLGSEDIQSYGNDKLEHQKDGHGDEGYNERKSKQLIGNGPVESAQPPSTNDVRGSNCIRKDVYDNRTIGFDEYPVEWSRNAYGYTENDVEAHKWRHSGGSTSESQRYVAEFPLNGYNHRGMEDEVGHRQSIEREAAIERSRQKRRIASQSSAFSESETGSNSPNIYGSVRMMHAYENDLCPEWEQTAVRDSEECANQSLQHRWDAVSVSDEKEAIPKTEYRMLRRPEIKESGEIIQQFSQMMLSDEQQDDEEEFQLTKLSRPSSKIIKRVAPSSGIVQTDDLRGQSSQMQPKNRHQREMNQTSGNEWDTSNQKSISQSQSQTSQQDTSGAQAFANIPAGPPADNIWEKRAEQRESAERERMAQREAMHQMRLQQHFPAVGEQPADLIGSMSLRSYPDELGSTRAKDYSRNNEVSSRKQNNKSRARDGRNWMEHKYSGGPRDDGDEGQGVNNVPFRGQREFVNSRVHRSSRGSSLIGARGARIHTRVSYPNARRGGSVPHQQQQVTRGQQRYGEKGPAKQGGRRNEMQFAEKDNFSNMGEFHVEDTYTANPTADLIVEEKESSVQAVNSHQEESQLKEPNSATERRQRAARGASHRSTQQLYEPRKRQEYNRSGRRTNRGGNAGATNASTDALTSVPEKTGSKSKNGEIRHANAHRNAGERERERDKRKRTAEVEGRDQGDFVDSTKASAQRAEGYRRGDGSKSGPQQSTRRKRHSPHHMNAPRGDDFVPHTKPAIAPSEGQEEWETASESSDFVSQQMMFQRRNNAPVKYNNSRRPRGSNGQKRSDNAGAAPNRAVNNSKNVKPASITSQTAVRDASSIKEEMTTAMAEVGRRDTCKDGLAGLDINNAGVIVIDDRPDGLLEDINENDDFEEVLSKKSRKLRQQQINEQAEAEERRRLKEKEKLERRKTRTQMKRRSNAATRNAVAIKGLNASEKTVSSCPSGANVFDAKTSEVDQTQNTLNTTVWNSSIIREQTVSSPPLERQVIPSPIARPTPRANASSTMNSNAANKKDLDLWAGVTDDKLKDPAVKRNSVEFSSNFSSHTRGDNGQYEFAFDPSIQENPKTVNSNGTNSKMDGGDNIVKQPAESMALASSLPANDDECLKQRLDKVKDFWPGQQQYSNNHLLGRANEKALVTDKNATNRVSATSISHGPNVAKVRPQPQTSEQSSTAIIGSMKEMISSTHSVPSLPPPSPIACLPPGAYLQSLSQVPPPAPFPHYSVVFGDHYNPNSNSATAQTLFGSGMNKGAQAQSNRSRPGSFIEQSPLFIHPPPNAATAAAAAAANNLTWSNSNPQMELLGGAMNATPPLAQQQHQQQQVNGGGQRYQITSPRSTSSFGLGSMLGNSGKLAHIGPHQIPPPITHPPRNFMAPPPDFVPLSTTNLGAVGSQRNVDNSGNVALQHQMPPPSMRPAAHLQQPVNFTQQTHNGFSAGVPNFNQAPPLHHHAFTAPPPPLRYPTVSQLSNSEIGNIGATGPFPNVYKLSNNSAPPINRAGVVRSQHDRWPLPMNNHSHYLIPQNCQHQHAQQRHQQQQHGCMKETHTSIQGNIEMLQVTTTPDDAVRTSSIPTVSSPGPETIEGANQQQKAARV